MKEVDEKPAATPWGKKMTFGNMLAEFSTGGGGWVHSVSFSTNGEKLAWVGHDSSVSVANAAQDNQYVDFGYDTFDSTQILLTDTSVTY